ncbi:MAG: hypothetical protein H5T47_03285 [Archaeoglobi archaeon]|nr:hypothetical protein [Candidatus Mnemosynella bozhongmuii]
MKAKFMHSWGEHRYEAYVNEKKELVKFNSPTHETDLILSSFDNGRFYFIELWGAYGLSRNEFTVTDDRKEAFEIFSGIINELLQVLDDEEERAEAMKAVENARKILL